VRELSKTVLIIIDGGLNVENMKKCLAAEWAEEIAEDELDKSFLGMEFVVGFDLQNAENVEAELRKLENLGS